MCNNFNCKKLPNRLNINLSIDDLKRESYIEYKLLVSAAPIYEGKKILFYDDPKVDNYDQTFSHIVTKKNHTTGSREYDIHRLSYVPYIKNIISLVDCKDVCCSGIKCWKQPKKRKNRAYIYFSEIRYLIVFEEFKGSYKLITAFLTDKNTYHKGLLQDYNYYKV